MVDGYLMALGERVPCRRILESFQRVIGPPVATFGNRRIERRVYSQFRSRTQLSMAS